MTDYYKILDVPTDAEPKTIKQAYRDLAFKYHPDRNTETPEVSEKMKQINEAYAVLSNTQKRREYDSLRQTFGSSARHQFRQSHTEQDIFSGSDIHRIFEEMAKSFGFRGYDDIFREFYGKGYQSFEVKRPGIFMRGFIFSGSMGKPFHGAGRLPFAKRPLVYLAQRAFEKLSGLTPQDSGKDLYEMIHIDTALAQTGGPYAYYHQKRSKKLVVTIPRGVRDGQKIRLAGMGESGKGPGVPGGDLYLKIRVKKPLLERIKKLIS
ncbi:MAG: DnaJ domain-containing protein [Desulfobacterales bacterium]|nr:DnaJ domain-containing protein [Desulfobacterales bacterium]MDX2513323.1 DnaJ domain-containing protein [Desulfobacterales bacterium]